MSYGWIPRIGDRVTYCGQVICDANTGGPVEFVVMDIDPPGTSYKTLDGNLVSTEHIVHLAAVNDPAREQIFASALSKLSPREA